MKDIKWFGLALLASAVSMAGLAQTPSPEAAAAATTTQAAPALSPSAAEVVRLAEAGTSEDVLLAYVQNAQSPFNLSADQILYLRDIGVSSGVTTAMLNRDSALRAQPQAVAPAPEPAQAAPPQPPAPAAEAPVVTAPLTPPAEYVGTPPPDVNYFYQDLSPYGTWVDLDGVGWCWQPRVVIVNRGWRPYCDAGHWVYTDDGWFWASDYSWGWAAFHYGRWHLHPRCGWVWLPDRVWGPSWVLWRSEGDRCGWAPLPPHADFDARLGWRFNGLAVSLNFDFGLRPDHFTFIAMRDFNERDYRSRCLPATEVTRIYNHTTVINNYVINNNTVINNGIRVEQVSAATHSPIRRVAVREAPPVLGRGTRLPAAEHGSLVVYRTPLHAPAAPTSHIVAQKVDARHPVIQHGPVAVPQSAPRGPLAGSGPANRLASGSWNSRPAPTSPQFRQENQPSVPKAPTPGPVQPRTSPQPFPHMDPGTAPPRPSPGINPRPPGNEYPVQVPRYGEGDQRYPLRSGAQPQPNSQDRQQYYPKSYHQAAEVQRLPPVNTVAPGQPAPQGKTPPGQSRKND